MSGDTIRGLFCNALSLLALVVISLGAPAPAEAQVFQFNSVEIQGNQRIEPGTILTYAAIPRGQAISAGELNGAYQRILDSGLFESVEIDPRGSTLVIEVVEFPTINRISIEGNARLADEDLSRVIRSAPRRVYSPSVASADAERIANAYAQSGRLAATVTPKIIRRSENRVDLVFEVAEGRVIEIERVSFVGNRSFSERRLRGVLESKQAGLLRNFIRSDTFIADRIEFDKQVLRDFYLSRGFVDFQVLSVTSEFSRERNAFFITVNIQEGQRFTFGEITTSSLLEEVDPDVYFAALRIRSGADYSPTIIDRNIARLERLALQQGLDFVRVEPRITRNDRELTLDVEFEMVQGPRIFVERIDIEGNATTLDRVIRRQFRTVEGDPFNPREIRQAAERIRALGFFSEAEVNSREGSDADQVIVDVDVTEQPTGTLSFGASYSTDTGAGINFSLSERNFLGRGQFLRFSVTTGSDSGNSEITFAEPAFLGRDLQFGSTLYYRQTDNDSSFYDTRSIGFSPSLTFPLSEFGRLQVRYTIEDLELSDVDRPDPTVTGDTGSSAILRAEEGSLLTSSVGYSYTHDTRDVGLNPNAGVLLRFGQDFSGLGGDTRYVRTTALVSGETRVFREDVTLRATLEGGALTYLNGNSRVTDRFFLNTGMRGFATNGIGPRDLNVSNRDALGGNYFAVARFDAEFPLGIPEEYGISGGLFLDVGSVWSLNNRFGGPNGLSPVDDSLNVRSTIGFSLFWDTQIGPLRFNFSRALMKEDYDEEEQFEFTVSTRF